MRPFTLKANVTTKDKSSKQVDRITKSYMKMGNTISKQSKIANSAVSRFANNVGRRAKKVMVSMNNMNASINRGFRNLSKKLGSLGLIVGFTAVFSVLSSGVGVFADFEQANAGLAAVMGKTVEQNSALIKDSKRLGAVTAKTATEVVGLQESFARLGFVEKDILNMTESTIAGSIAMRGELSATADMVGAMVKTFDNFSSVDTPAILDQLTKATQTSALNFEKLQTALPNVAGAANAAGLSFNKMLALLGKLSDAGIDASMSSTSLRNILLQSAKAGRSYEGILEDIMKNQDKLTSSMNAFGVRAAVPATILSQKLNETLELSKDILNSEGTAAAAAAKELDTLRGRATLLTSAYEGFILSLDDGTGAMSGFLKKTLEVATEILALGSETAKAKDQLIGAELSIRRMANTGIFLLKTIKLIVIAYLSFRAVMIATNIVIGAYNIIVGIQAALTGTLTRGIVANSIALKAYAITTKIATVAAWAWSIALNTGIWPITAVVAAIALLAIGVRALIKNWSSIVAWVKTSNNIFAKLIRSYLKPIVFLFRQIKEAWLNIKAAFQTGGFLEGIKQIGKSILSFMLAPLEAILKLTTKLTGGRVGGDALKKISEFRDSLNFKGEVTTKQDSMVSAIEKNTEELAKNTDAAKDQVSGRFKTYIVRDANISERTSSIVQRELATTAISNESKIANDQKRVFTNSVNNEIVKNTTINNQRELAAATTNNESNDQKEINEGVVTPRASRKSSNSANGTIHVVIDNRTDGRLGVEVEGTGINVTTTGND